MPPMKRHLALNKRKMIIRKKAHLTGGRKPEERILP
jgi:hypothetical protein